LTLQTNPIFTTFKLNSLAYKITTENILKENNKLLNGVGEVKLLLKPVFRMIIQIVPIIPVISKNVQMIANDLDD